MNSGPPPDPHGEPAGPPDDATGLPVLRTWRGVYLFVFAVFVVYVVLLTALTRAYV